MRVMVVGSGAREHALAWKLARSPRVATIITAPGNPGTATLGENLPLDLRDLAAVAAAAEERRVDLTIVGPEDPLARGLVDLFERRGLRVAGPTSAAARIESSKVWAKEVMAAAGVPTAAARRFTDASYAARALADFEPPVVIKASGLAAGKGVVVAQTRREAERAVRAMLEEGALGDAGREILIEEYLSGQEVSLLALTDGETTYPLIPARDYKRAHDGDAGPNTGGMGAYAPVPAVTAADVERIMTSIVRPTLAELRHRGITYRGVLYAGLILTANGPKVLEFNSRFGDPEAEVVLPLLRSDLAPLLEAVADGRLREVAPPEWLDEVCVGVVLASGGYPERYETGQVIHGLDRLPAGVEAFHAGTRISPAGELLTAGGRVLTLVARAPDFARARDLVYAAAERVHFEGRHYRRDIALGEAPAAR